MQHPEQHHIICIHSGGRKPRREVLEANWRQALAIGFDRDQPGMREQLDAVSLEFVYYGDLIDAVLPDASHDPVLDVADRDAALAQLATLDRSKRFRRVEYERQPGKSALKEFATDLLAPVAHTVGLGTRFWSRAMPELGEYLHGGGFAHQVNDRLNAALARPFESGRNDNVLLIAHGLGSIPAYHALMTLAERRPGVKVNTWITLGSPLADETVKKSLPHTSLTNLINWYNLAAEDDWVCHDETMANDFAHLLDQHLLSRLEDFSIYNMAVRYGKVAPHSALGYLAHPRMVQLVADWLRGRPA